MRTVWASLVGLFSDSTLSLMRLNGHMLTMVLFEFHPQLGCIGRTLNGFRRRNILTLSSSMGKNLLTLER